MVVSLGEFGLILALPLWLQFVLGFEAVQTGLILLALAIGSFAASGLAGALSGRVAPVRIVRVGILAEIIGVAAVGFVIAPDASWIPLVPALFVYGFGVGLATAQLTGVVLVDVPPAEGGQASGTQSTARQLGAALGIAVLGTILFATTAADLTARLDDRRVPAAQRDQVVSAVVDSAGGAIAGLTESPQTADLADDAKAAFSDGTKYASYAAAGFLVLGLLATFSLGSGARTDESDPVRESESA
jgi:MFS family permease